MSCNRMIWNRIREAALLATAAILFAPVLTARGQFAAPPPVGGPGPSTPAPAVTTVTAPAPPPEEPYTPPTRPDYSAYPGADQPGLGNRLNEIGRNASGDWLTILDALDRVPGNEKGGTLDRIGPGESDAFTGAGLANGRRHIESIRSHLDEESGQRKATGSQQGGKWLAWAEGSDGHFEIPEGPYNFDVAGVSAGVDHDIGNSFVVGVGIGMSRTDFDWQDSASEAKSDAFYAGTYANWQVGSGRIEAGANYGDSHTDAKRRIQFGDIERIASSGFNGHPYAAFVDGSYEWKGDPWRIAPMISMSYVGQQEDGYTETGAGSLNLAVDDRRNDSAQAGGGVRVSRVFQLRYVKLIPTLKAQFGRELNTGSRDTNARFADTSESTFTMNGPESPADNTELGACLSAYSMGFTGYIRYDHTFGDWQNNGYAISAGVRSRF
jgi:outer membrane autotransporter protein